MFGIKRTSKVLALVAAMALVATALIAPGVAPAKKALTVNIAAPMGIKGGGSITGKASGSIGGYSFKKMAVTGTAVPPKMTAVFNLAGGKVVAKTTDGHVKKGVLYGTFKLSGTGKFKNIKGGGNLSASLTSFVFKWVGKASY